MVLWVSRSVDMENPVMNEVQIHTPNLRRRTPCQVVRVDGVKDGFIFVETQAHTHFTMHCHTSCQVASYIPELFAAVFDGLLWIMLITRHVVQGHCVAKAVYHDTTHSASSFTTCDMCCV